jgi:hypothetical protein
MPTVNGKSFSYGSTGKKAAKAFGKKTGGKVEMKPPKGKKSK